jgi:hypothetical protein
VAANDTSHTLDPWIPASDGSDVCPAIARAILERHINAFRQLEDVMKILLPWEIDLSRYEDADNPELLAHVGRAGKPVIGRAGNADRPWPQGLRKTFRPTR